MKKFILLLLVSLFVYHRPTHTMQLMISDPVDDALKIASVVVGLGCFTFIAYRCVRKHCPRPETVFRSRTGDSQASLLQANEVETRELDIELQPTQ